MSQLLESQYGGRFGRFADFKAQTAKEYVTGNKTDLLYGNQIVRLPEAQLMHLADQVSAMLAPHSATMLQFPPEKLVKDYLLTGLAAAVIHSGQLVSFGKLYPWIGVSNEGKFVFELGSWITKEGEEKKGYGSQVVIALAELAHQITPNAQVVALTEISNLPPQKTLAELGGIKIAMPSTVKVLLGEGNATLVCFDMTAIGK